MYAVALEFNVSSPPCTGIGMISLLKGINTKNSKAVLRPKNSLWRNETTLPSSLARVAKSVWMASFNENRSLELVLKGKFKDETLAPEFGLGDWNPKGRVRTRAEKRFSFIRRLAEGGFISYFWAFTPKK